VPGVGKILAGQIRGRLGDPHRFTSLAAARSFSGLIPHQHSSGLTDAVGGPTNTATPACARRCSWPPTTPARPTHPGRPLPAAQVPDRPPPHPWALGTIATVLCTRIVACLRNNTPYQIRDVDGSPITPAQGRAIVATRYQIPPQVRAAHPTASLNLARHLDNQ